MSRFLVCIFHTRFSLQSQSCFYNDPDQDIAVRLLDYNILKAVLLGLLNEFVPRVLKQAVNLSCYFMMT